MENKHYLYRHIRLDKNEPFYIGVGTKQYEHTSSHKQAYGRAYSKSQKSNIWFKIVNKTEYEVEIMLESDDYNFIKQKEIEFVKLYGRIDLNTGTLANLTDGGEGMLNIRFSDQTIEKMSKSAKIRYKEGRGLSKEKQILKGLKISISQKGVKKNTKLTEDQKKYLYERRLEKLSKRVIQEDINGNFIKEWYTTVDVAKHFGITYKAIWKACKGYNKGYKSKGFRWKFKE